jgi:glycosyltransferase involved in cell wall biosynthesis
MNIALIAPTEIPARRANTVQVMKMAQALATTGQNVTVYSPLSSTTDRCTLPSWEQLAQHYGLTGSLSPAQEFPLTWLSAATNLRRYDYSLKAVLESRKNLCDLIYTRLIQAAALASLLGIPTILEVHDLPKGRSAATNFRLFLGGRGRCRLVMITRALADDLVRYFEIPTPGEPAAGIFSVILPDGVDMERYEKLPEPQAARMALRQEAGNENLELEQFTIGYTGHLYAGRGVEFILDLAERLPDIQFLLAGGEPADVERNRQVARRRELKRVILTGFVPNAALPTYQAACDVLLMPYGEKVAASSGGDIARYLSPMKLFEYMACNRPVIASDLAPLQEILNASNALLLPARNLEAWSEAILHLRNHPEEGAKLAAQARLDAVQYSWEKRAERLLAGLDRSRNEKTA